MNALTEIIAAADRINVGRAWTNYCETYRTWQSTARPIDWILLEEAERDYLKLDDAVRALDE